MELKKLLESLEIDQADEFQYFENFADLIESDEEVDLDTLYLLFSKTDNQLLSEVIENYFEEMVNILPESEAEMYTLMENIKMSLIGLARNPEEENGYMQFAEEVLNFKNWFTHSQKVLCVQSDTREENYKSIRDALILLRLEKLGYEEYEYDFTDVLDYELNEYAINLRDLLNSEEDDHIDDDFDEGDSDFSYDYKDN